MFGSGSITRSSSQQGNLVSAAGLLPEPDSVSSTEETLAHSQVAQSSVEPSCQKNVQRPSLNGRLPLELLLRLFSQKILSLGDLCACALVNHHWLNAFYNVFYIVFPYTEISEINAFFASDEVEKALWDGSKSKFYWELEEGQNFSEKRPFRELKDTIFSRQIDKGPLYPLLKWVLSTKNDQANIPLQILKDLTQSPPKRHIDFSITEGISTESVNESQHVSIEQWRFFRQNISAILLLAQTGEFNIDAWLEVSHNWLARGLIGALERLENPNPEDNLEQISNIHKDIEFMLQNKIFFILHKNPIYPKLDHPLLWLVNKIINESLATNAESIFQLWFEKFIDAGMSIDKEEEKYIFNIFQVGMRNSHLQKIETLIKKRVNLKWPIDHFNNKLLHIVIKENNIEIVDFLIKNKVNLNWKGPDCKTSLHLAAIINNPAIVSLLLENNADPNCQDCNGETPLSIAAKNYKEALDSREAENREITADEIAAKEIIKELKAKGADEQWQDTNQAFQLFLAVHKAEFDKARALLKIGIKPTWHNYGGTTALHFAVFSTNMQMVQALLDAGADPYPWNIDPHKTPLYVPINAYALYKSRPELAPLLEIYLPITQVLLKKIKDINQVINRKDRNGHSILYCAIESGCSLEFIELLLSAGADPHPQHIELGNTPLYAAIRRDAPLIIEALLKRIKDINRKGRDGYRLLHLAIENPHGMEIIGLLLNAGADPYPPDTKLSNTPLYTAINHRSLPMIKTLLGKIEDINRGACDSSALLHIAIKNECSLEIIELLLNAGVDPCPQNIPFERTPLYAAMNRWYSRKPLPFIQVLLKKTQGIHQEDSEGRNLLDFAIEKEWDSEIILALQLQGEEPDLEAYAHQSPVHFAIVNDGSIETIEKLLYTVEINGIYPWEYTLLHFAIQARNIASEKHLALIQMLLRKGADLTVKNDFGQIPLQLAIQEKCKSEIILALQLKGAKPALNNDAHQTPLHFALADQESTAEDIKALLYTVEENINQQYRGDNTLLQYAINKASCIKKIKIFSDKESTLFKFSIKNLLLFRKIIKKASQAEGEKHEEVVKSLRKKLGSRAIFGCSWFVKFSIWCFSF